MPARNNAGQNPQETAPAEDCKVYKVKSHTDGDFRFGKPLLKKFGFGNKAELKVKVEECTKGKKVKLLIEKV